MSHCRGCKHFTPPGPREEYGSCELIDDEKNSPIDEAPKLIICWDYEGYSAGAYIHPDFGCVMWQAKEDEPAR